MTQDLQVRPDPHSPASPAETDIRLQLQASSLGVSLKARSKLTYHHVADGPPIPGDYVLTGFDFIGDDGKAGAVLDVLKSAMHPETPGQIQRWLGELDAVTIKRAEDAATVGIRLAAFTRALAAYPADVVKAALLDQRWKWWPALAEVEDICDNLTKTRAAMIQAVEFAAERLATKQLPAPEKAPQERTVTPVDSDRADYITQSAGFTPRRMEAVRKRPMATSDADLYAKPAPQPHWSETVAPDGPEMAALRAVRLANPIMEACMAKPEVDR